jgi:hypothetical protein
MQRDISNITRRDFLKLAGKTAVVSSGFLAGCAAAPAPNRAPNIARAIDIHHHYFAPELIDDIKSMERPSALNTFRPRPTKKTRSRYDLPALVG